MILWRQKCIDGTITKEELTEAMRALRGERMASAQASTKTKTARAKAAIPTADDMLAELGINSPTDD